MRKDEFENLTNEELRNFYLIEDWRDLPLPSRIMEELNVASQKYILGEKLNEIEKIINEIVIDRFIESKL